MTINHIVIAFCNVYYFLKVCSHSVNVMITIINARNETYLTQHCIVLYSKFVFAQNRFTHLLTSQGVVTSETISPRLTLETSLILN